MENTHQFKECEKVTFPLGQKFRFTHSIDQNDSLIAF